MISNMKKPNDHYTGILLEEINDRLQGIEEGLGDLRDIKTDIRELKERFDGIDDWSDVAKLVIKDHSKTLNNHETRLTKLKAI
jgi:hypothetical protein